MGSVIEIIAWAGSAILVPVIGTLFVKIDKFRDELSHYYARQSHVQELEDRVTAHLLRIERKLDATSLQAAGLKARLDNNH